MSAIPYRVIPPLLLGLFSISVLAGCGDPREEPAGEEALHFPEIRDMALVVLEGRRREGVADSEWLYFIDRYEVTNGDYHEFLRRSGYVPGDTTVFLNDWDRGPAPSRAPRDGTENFPVVFVSFHDALKYAEYLGKDLPTRQQWLDAALKTSGKYPWGDKFSAYFCNSLRTHIGGPARVGTFENGKSGWGCYDMVGNVAEWCKTPFKGEEGDLVELTFHVQGGSFNDGGEIDEKDGVFNLSAARRYSTVRKLGNTPIIPRRLEPDSRNNAVGFRCVRNDALPFLRETFTSRLSALRPDAREAALDETALIQEDLHSVLKLLRFENAIQRKVEANPSPSLVQLQHSNGEAAFLLCDTEGRAGLFRFDGKRIWSRERSEEDALYEFHTTAEPGRASPQIIMEGLWSNLLIALDSATGAELWRIKGDGEARHIVPVPKAGGRSDLLVHWSMEESRINEIPIRYGLFDYLYWHTTEWAAGASEEPYEFNLYRYFYDRIDYMALDMLIYRMASNPSLRDRLLSFFTESPEDVLIERDGPRIVIQIDVTNFGPAALYAGEEILDGFQIYWQAYVNDQGEIYQIDEPQVVVRYEPASRLALYDLGTGAVKWSLDFPGSLCGFQGVIRGEMPILDDQGKILSVVLEDEPNRSLPAPAGRTRILRIGARGGSLLSLVDPGLDGGRLTDLAAVSSSPGDFMGIIDSEELLCFRLEEGGGGAGSKRDLKTLLGSVSEVTAFSRNDGPEVVEDPSALLNWYREPAARGAPPSGTIPLLDRLLVFPSVQSPWLISKLDDNERCVLLKGAAGEGFREALVLEGDYTRNVYLSGGALFAQKEYFLLFGTKGNLLCFDALTGAFLWKRNVEEISELHRHLSDFDRDGFPEVLITSSSGEIRAVELLSGNIELYLKKTGGVFTCLLPFLGDEDHAGEVLVGIQEEGLYVLDPLKPSASVAERNLMLTISELERWMGKGTDL